jgi:hypothetical protein
MSNRNTFWLILAVVLVVGAGYYLYFHKGNHANTAAEGRPTGNINLAKYGLIKGSSGFPTAAPADLQVCGQNTASGSVTCTNAVSDNSSTQGFSYTLAVLPGTYQVYSVSRSHPEAGKGYYNSVTKCVPTVDEDEAKNVCKKNEAVIPVTVAAGQSVTHADAWWYATVYDMK